MAFEIHCTHRGDGRAIPGQGWARSSNRAQAVDRQTQTERRSTTACGYWRSSAPAQGRGAGTTWEEQLHGGDLLSLLPESSGDHEVILRALYHAFAPTDSWADVSGPAGSGGAAVTAHGAGGRRARATGNGLLLPRQSTAAPSRAGHRGDVLDPRAPRGDYPFASVSLQEAEIRPRKVENAIQELLCA
jgi:hypothetical protein